MGSLMGNVALAMRFASKELSSLAQSPRGDAPGPEALAAFVKITKELSPFSGDAAGEACLFFLRGLATGGWENGRPGVLRMSVSRCFCRQMDGLTIPGPVRDAIMDALVEATIPREQSLDPLDPSKPLEP